MRFITLDATTKLYRSGRGGSTKLTADLQRATIYPNKGSIFSGSGAPKAEDIIVARISLQLAA